MEPSAQSASSMTLCRDIPGLTISVLRRTAYVVKLNLRSLWWYMLSLLKNTKSDSLKSAEDPDSGAVRTQGLSSKVVVSCSSVA